MKTKKLIGILLSAVLVFTTVFAGAGSVYAETETPKDYPVVGAIKSDEGTMKAAAETNTDVAVTATSMNVNKTAPMYSTIEYDRSKLIYVRVKIPKAGAFAINVTAGADGVVGLYDSLSKDAKLIASSPDVYKRQKVLRRNEAEPHMACRPSASLGFPRGTAVCSSRTDRRCRD